MKRIGLVTASLMLGALAFAQPASAQVVLGDNTTAEAEADSEAASNASSGAVAATGDVTVDTVFEASDIPDDVTVHSAPALVTGTPPATAPCVVTHGGGLTIIDVGVSYGGGHIDDLCQTLEVIRVLGGTFGTDPVVRDSLVQLACDRVPGMSTTPMCARPYRSAAVEREQPAQASDQTEAQATERAEPATLRGRQETVQAESRVQLAAVRRERAGPDQ